MRWIRRLFSTASVVACRPVERTVPFWPSEWIERLQRYRLRGIIRHAYETVPFYRQWMDERGLRPSDFRSVSDLSQLPLIDGMTVRQNTEAFLSARYGDDSRVALHSSGSTSGVRRVIYWDSGSVLRKLSRNERDRVVLHNLLGQERGYRHIHIATPASAYYELKPCLEGSKLMRRSLAQHDSLSAEEPFEAVADRINAIRPQIVSSYASYAEHFFRFLADRQMSISVPRVWIYGSEMLSPSGRELIEKTFNCPTYSTYQTTETGRLGFQCERRQGFHLNVDLCAVRLIDDHGRTVQPGEVGEVVISNLHNHAMVLLNYRLEDRGVMATEPCSCGRSLPLLERLEGRAKDVLYLSDGRSMPGLTLEGLCYEELKSALKIQIVQSAPGHVQWRIVPFSRAERQTLRRDLLERCRVVLGEDTKVEVEFVEEIPTPPHGKFPRVVSHVDGPNASDPATSGEG